MSDQSSAPPGKPTNGGDTAAGAQPLSLPINVLAQYIKDFSFENPNAPNSLMPNQSAPQVKIQVDVNARPMADAVYEVVLSIRAEATIDEQTVFLAELAYAGLFSLPGIPAEHLRPVLLIEAPRILFPFARAIVAEATKDGGYSPLMINPIDFAELYLRQQPAQDDAQPAVAN
ncbi:MAG: protein-export chaperone SecB [Azospirillum sp.]|nr:protein-export chaperone SecB [Azospirillum sp.]